MDSDLKDRELSPDADAHDPSREHADALLNGAGGAMSAGGKDLANKADKNGFYNPGGDAVSAGGLDNLEAGAKGASLAAGAALGGAGALGAVGGLFSGSEKGRWAIFALNRKKGITGVVVGLLAAGGIFGASIGSGPLEFIHMAQNLHMQHFSQQDEASNIRMGRVLRFARSGNVGETRISFVTSKLYNNMIADLKGIGLEPHYSTGNVADGFTVDKTSKDSPYKNMSDEDIKSTFEQKGFNVELDSKAAGGKILIGAGSSNAANLKANAFLAEQSKGGAAAKYLRARALNKFGLTPKSWHLLKRVDAKQFKTQASLLNYIKDKWSNRVSSGGDAAVADASNAKEDTGTTDKDGKPVTTDSPGGKIDTAGGYESKLGGLKSGGIKAAGGLSAVLAIACTAKAVDDKLPEIKYVQVIAPLLNLGMGIMNVGYQIMAGGADITMAELSYLHSQFNTVEVVNGHATTKNQSDNVIDKSAQGQSGGEDVPQTTKDLISQGSPPWLDWTQTSAVKAGCSAAGQVITAGVGFVVSVFSGGTASLIGQTLIAAVVAPHVVNALSDLLSGKGLDLANTTGPQRQILTHYGVQIGANANSMGMGGSVVSSKQLSDLNALVNDEQTSAWDSKSFIARIFDPQDSRSLLSHAIDTQDPLPTQNLSNIASSFMNIGSSLLSLPTKFFGNTASAVVQPYQYPFPVVATSLDKLNNPKIVDPIANAEDVGKILDNNNSNGEPDYIQKAKDCFGVDIAKTPDEDGVSRWSAIPDSNAAQTAMTNFYGGNGKYDASGCAENGTNDDWLRISSFIGDSGVVDGYGCYHGLSISCQNDSMDDGSAAGGSADSTGSPVAASGSAAQIAQQLLDEWGKNLTGNSVVKDDLTATAQGKTITNSDTCGNTIAIDANLLQVLLTTTTKYKLSLYNIVTGHGCDQFLHPKGRASDIGGATDLASGKSTNFTPGSSNDNQSLDRSFYVYMASIMPKGSELGQDECTGRTGLTAPPGITFFSDTCTHQHIDLGDK